ncbi:MAG: excinuclease ABC subunit UvrC [Clostridiales bacterium]|nr:excinuclease ABC subunit UvrC [Clostridiales bacterium]
MMTDIVAAKLKLLPSLPGVYKMLNAEGEVIYVGKAKSLKNRVRSYFQSGKQAIKVAAMVSHIVDFETVIVRNEMEALTLESNFIKELSPKYNIKLKDDQHFPYVRVDLRQDFPRIEVVRRVAADGATYLGPYFSATQLRGELSVIREHFPIRNCKKDMKLCLARRERPCLMFHIGKCCAPCSGEVEREKYHGYLQEAISFLRGNGGAMIAEFERRMIEASERLDFEAAARLRDRIEAIRTLKERQIAISTNGLDADVFVPARGDTEVLVYALFVRDGKVVGAEPYFLSGLSGENDAELLDAFLGQFYGELALPPEYILLSALPENAAALSDWLSDLRKKRVYMAVPQKGEKYKLLQMAAENGVKLLEKRAALAKHAQRPEDALCALAERIGLAKAPRRMECFDNSHLRGQYTVSSMVVFTDGKVDKSAYRHFRIRGDTQGDDLLAMREVLNRRFARLDTLPDLLVIDGGKTQLAVAMQILDALGLDIPAIGLAEAHEHIYLPDRDAPVILSRGDPALQLLQRLRDEAHRFAVSYHRNVRQREALFSALDNIPGVGEKRKRALFDALVDIDSIKNASVETLSAVPGMTRPVAEAVWAHFHPIEL